MYAPERSLKGPPAPNSGGDCPVGSCVDLNYTDAVRFPGRGFMAPFTLLRRPAANSIRGSLTRVPPELGDRWRLSRLAKWVHAEWSTPRPLAEGLGRCAAE